jgi:dTDP-glucose pyrophosphorylase
MAAEIEKAVVLARGLGKRMRERDAAAALSREQASVADSGLKAMIPIGRPFLDYALSALADAGFRRVCLVIGPEHDAVRAYYERLAPRRIAIEYAIQEEARGTADAVLAAEDFIGAGEFAVMNSDNYYPSAMLRTLRAMGEPGAVMFGEEALVRNSNIPAERVRLYAYAVVGADGYLEELVEKPDEQTARRLAARALVSMNCWRLPAAMLDFCHQVRVSPRGELELPVAIGDAVRAGMRLRILMSEDGVLDISRRADIPAVAERLRGVEVAL